MVLQAMGRAAASMAVSLSRYAYVFIPVLYLMHAAFGMYGIVWALPVSDVICAILAAVVLRKSVKRCFAERNRAA